MVNNFSGLDTGNPLGTLDLSSSFLIRPLTTSAFRCWLSSWPQGDFWVFLKVQAGSDLSFTPPEMALSTLWLDWLMPSAHP